MTGATDPLDALLASFTVPAMSPDLEDRIVAAATRPGRRPAVLAKPPRRRWTRRGAWTTILAINLVLASAVAAAIGGGVISGARIAEVARHVVARLHPAHPPVHPRPVVHRAPSAAAAPHRAGPTTWGRGSWPAGQVAPPPPRAAFPLRHPLRFHRPGLAVRPLLVPRHAHVLARQGSGRPPRAMRLHHPIHPRPPLASGIWHAAPGDGGLLRDRATPAWPGRDQWRAPGLRRGPAGGGYRPFGGRPWRGAGWRGPRERWRR